MKYTNERDNIRSGDVLAWSHRGVRSWHDLKIWFVRLFQRSEYSHVGIAWVTGDRVFVIEAVQPLVRIFPLSKLLDDGAYWITTNAPWEPTTKALALECVGDKYSQPQAVQAPFEEPPEDRLWQCAELVGQVLRVDGIELGRVYTPSAIVRAAMARRGARSTLLEL